MANNLTQRFYDLVKQTAETWKIPNISYALIQNNEIVDINSYNLGKFYPCSVGANKLYRIGSNSKAFACTVLVDLEAQGKLSLNDPVVNYFPDFKLGSKELTKKIRIKDLVTHATGLSKYAVSMLCYLGYPRDAIIDGYQHLDSVRPYLSSFQYSNGLYLVAGEIIKKVTGCDNGDYFKRNLFSPLEMHNTFSSLEDIYQPNLAVPYVDYKGESYAISQSPFGDAIGVGGNINTTASDLAKWLQFNLKITSDPDLSHYLRLFEPQVSISSPKHGNFFSQFVTTNAYLMGWYRAIINNNTVFEHMGGFPGYMSNLSFSPELKSGVIILTNKSDVWHPLEMLRLNFYELITSGQYTNILPMIKEQREKFHESLDEKINAFQPMPMPNKFKGLNNFFQNGLYGRLHLITDQNGPYLILGPKQARVRLEYVGDNTFKLVDEYYNFGTMFKLILLQLSEDLKKATLEIQMDDQHGGLSWVDTQHFIAQEI